MADGAPRMVFLGFGKYVRADKIYALEPLGEGLRGNPGSENARIVDEALDLAQRVADAAEQGKVDVVDLGRRARRLLASTTRTESEQLF